MKEDPSLEVWSLVVWSVKILEETRDTSRVGDSGEMQVVRGDASMRVGGAKKT
jgi:hypothetical protein